MRLFWLYLRSRWKSAALFLLFSAVFAVVFTLYQLSAEAVGYAVLLCAFLCAVLLPIDFLAFRRRHKRLRELVEELDVGIQNFPSPGGPLEEDYQAVLQAMQADKRKMAGRMERRYAELAEYYTLWVHQIKTPIAAMDLLLQQEDSPQNRELADELQRVNQYVEMALCYIRLDSTSTDYVVREYDLDAIVKQAIRKFAAQFIRKKLHLEYRPVCCTVLTDEKWLLFVIEQVLSNALKYTRSGGVSITLREPKALVISDTGIGIAPEDLARVFDNGFTGYNGRSDKKASGIGLYLCRRILGKLGHGIAVRSEPGKGTSVELRLDTAPLEIE